MGSLLWSSPALITLCNGHRSRGTPALGGTPGLDFDRVSGSMLLKLQGHLTTPLEQDRFCLDPGSAVTVPESKYLLRMAFEGSKGVYVRP